MRHPLLVIAIGAAAPVCRALRCSVERCAGTVKQHGSPGKLGDVWNIKMEIQHSTWDWDVQKLS